MNGARIRFLGRETLLAFHRGRLRSWLSVATLAVTLTVLGGFLLLSYNLTWGIESFRQESKIVVYLKDLSSGGSSGSSEETPEAFVSRVGKEIRAVVPSVDSLTYVSKEDALQRIKEKIGEENPLLEAVEGNPLPSSYEIRLSSLPDDMEPVAEHLRAIKGVTDVAYGRKAMETLFRIAVVVRLVLLVVGVVLAFFTMVIVANTIKLTIYARRTQIEIMQLVGATNWFIRLPFLIEGALQGLMASTAALLLLWGGFELLSGQLSALSISLVFLPTETVLILFGTGVAVGVIGVLVSVGEFLSLDEE